MALIVIGLGHRSVPLDVLGRTAVADDDLPKALADLLGRPHLSEAVVLSTCNRTEVFGFAERFHGAIEDVCRFLGERAGMTVEQLAGAVYAHYENDAATHLFRVVTGLDSVVVGEHEILGQVRRAWDLARVEGASGPHLNVAFRHALEVGKRARAETAIGRHAASVSSAAVELAAQHLGGLAGRRAVVLGAGEMGEGIAVAAARFDAGAVSVVNRTWARAVEVADRVGVSAVALEDLDQALAEADVLITSTGASDLMVGANELSRVVAARQGRGLLIVDVAVPRDVDPAARSIDGVTLLDMDDVGRFADENLDRRRGEISRVEDIIEVELLRYLDLAGARQADPLVTALRARVEQIRTAEVDRFLARTDGTTVEADQVHAMTRAILAKALHEPTVRLRAAAGTARGERLGDALRELFDL